MPILTVPRLQPSAKFSDENGNLTLEGYRFLDGIYLRVGGSLDSLNAVTLVDKTWDAPNPIGVTTPSTGKFTTLTVATVTSTATGTIDKMNIGVTTPGTGKFTSLQATTGFGCNGKTPQTSVDTDVVDTTPSTNTTPYGFTTSAQADDIITKLNTIITALIANGILV